MTAHPAPSANHVPARRIPSRRALIAVGTVVVWNGAAGGALLIWAWVLIPAAAETSVDERWATISAIIISVVGLAAVALSTVVGLVVTAVRLGRRPQTSVNVMSTRGAILIGTTSAAVGFAVGTGGVLLFSLALSLS